MLDIDENNETYKPCTLFELFMNLQQLNACRVLENKEYSSVFYPTPNFLW